MTIDSGVRPAHCRVAAASLLLLAGLLLTAAVAFAAKPAKGKTYSGEIKRSATVQFPISFKASRSGKRVSGFSFPSSYPVYCQGGGFGAPQSRSARISRRGTFEVKLPIVFTPTHQRQGFVRVSGRFLRHKREKGEITTHFDKSPSCNGAAHYSAHA